MYVSKSFLARRCEGFWQTEEFGHEIENEIIAGFTDGDKNSKKRRNFSIEF
jgi:hypothetical protein